MNTIDFVEGIRKWVLEASVADTISVASNPPGRKPNPDLVDAGRWYLALNERDRDRARYLMELTAKQAVFGMLCVLDGDRKIDPEQGVTGNFELNFVHENGVDALAGPKGSVLHELL